jgi:peptidoglycan/LPS O-acetylase OafA/YrhL
LNEITYRPDIDGLRAVAILTVIAYHTAPGVMPGGFIGVDIFFVISGFLISGIILAELRAVRFSFAAFYGRRIRRIFPALILVTTATLLIGYFLLFPDEFMDLGYDALAGLTFTANLALSHEANYFDVQAAGKPLLHLWSLGIEEQFYIAWPCALWLTRRNRHHGLWLAGAAIMGSFSLNLIGLYVLGRENFVFYSPLTRLWELACGSLLAMVPANAAVTKGKAWVLAAAGSALIVAALIGVDGYDAYPGAAALLPVIGAMSLIAAGPHTWINRAILSNKAAVYTGLISYPLYLWHWPLLVFQSTLWPHSAISRVGALGLAILLAALTYRYIERPIRSGYIRRDERGAITRGLLVANLLIAVVAALTYSDRLTRALPASASRVLAARADWEFPAVTALDRRGNLIVQHISTDRPLDITLYIGDSHVQQYWPRLKYLAVNGRAAMNSLEVASYAGCPPLPGVSRRDPSFKCPEFFAQATQRALSPQVKVVVFAGWWEWYFLPQVPGAPVAAPIYRIVDSARRPLHIDSAAGREEIHEFGDLVHRLVGSGKRVYVLLSNPTSFALDPISMVQRISYKVSVPEAIDRQEFEVRTEPVIARLRDVARQNGAVVVDPAAFLCDPIRCAAASTEGEPLYKDSNHLRADYARRQSFLDVFNY